MNLISNLSRKSLLLFAALATLLAGCAPPLPTPDVNQDNVLHTPSGISFPHEVYSFTRSRVDLAANDSTPITVDYFFARADERVSMRVRVYPKTARTLHEELEILKQIQGAVENDSESRFVVTYDISASQGEKLYPGKRAIFRTSDNVFSTIYLFQYGDWYIEYHTTYHRDLEREAEAFVEEFKWNTSS